MMIPSKMNNKKIAIVGLGISGISAAKSILKSGAEVFAYDDMHQKNIHIKGLKVIKPENWPWSELNEIVISPGIPTTLPAPHPIIKMAKQKKIKIRNEIDIFARSKPKAKVIGITGTNGKSTTTSMISHIFNKLKISNQVGGNIGKAATDLIDPGENGFILLELSSFQLEITKELELDSCIILNVSSDHLDRHGTLRKYASTKYKITNFLKRDGNLIIGNDDIFCKEFLKKSKSSNYNISVLSKNDPLVKNFTNPTHNKQNISATLRFFISLGFSLKKIQKHLKSYKALPHRLENVSKIQNIEFINDSKSTNGESSKDALLQFKNIFWILGGKSKKEGIKCLLESLKNVKKCFLIGECAFEFAKELEGKVPFLICNKLETAIQKAFKEASSISKGTILFSPAAASFDQFDNFEVRGDHYKSLIANLDKHRCT